MASFSIINRKSKIDNPQNPTSSPNRMLIGGWNLVGIP
jgi:hypothetical protein